MSSTKRLILPTILQLRRASDHRRSICANYALFEQRKQEWVEKNPAATPSEFEATMQRLARQCGV